MHMKLHVSIMRNSLALAVSNFLFTQKPVFRKVQVKSNGNGFG